MLLSSASTLFAQTPGAPFNWAVHFAGTGAGAFATDGPDNENSQSPTRQTSGETRVTSSVSDNDNNTYVLLELWGSVKLGTTTYTAPNAAHHSVPILIKYNKTGTFLWARPLYTAGRKMLQRVKLTLDASKNPVVAGTYTNTDADGPDITLGSKTITDLRGIVAIKFNGNGSCLYIKTLDLTKTKPLYVKMLDADAANNIYMATSQDAPSEQGAIDHTEPFSDQPGAVRKMNVSLGLVWEKGLSKAVDVLGGSVNASGTMLIGFKLSYHKDFDTVNYIIDKKAYSWRMEQEALLYNFNAAGKANFTTIFKNSELPAPLIDNAGNGYFIQANAYEEQIGKNPYGVDVDFRLGKSPIIKIGANGSLISSKYININLTRNALLTVNKVNGEVYLATDFTDKYFYDSQKTGALVHGDFTFFAEDHLHYIAMLKYSTNLTEAGGLICIKNAAAVAVPSLSITPTGNLVLAGLAGPTPRDSPESGPAEPITIGNATYKSANEYDGFLLSIDPKGFGFTPTTTWTGKSGQSWAVGSNWNNGVPTVLSHAIIPAGLTNYPKIYPAVFYAGILEIANKATLTLPQTVQVKGIIRNNGELTYLTEGAFYSDVDIEGSGVTNINSKNELNWDATAIIRQKLVLNNIARITLSSAMTANEIQMNGGSIFTDPDKVDNASVIVLSDSPDALSGYSAARFISSTITRAVGNEGAYTFPVKNDIYAPLTLNFAGNTTTTSITLKMVPPPSTPQFGNTKINGVAVKSNLYYYNWQVEPNTYQNETGTLDAKLEVPFYPGMPATNHIGFIHSNYNYSYTGAANWQQPQVVTTGSTKTVVAKMNGTNILALRIFSLAVTDAAIPDLTASISSFSPASGAKGTSVTIKGSNFTGTTAVSFGGTAASSFTVNSATSITAVIGDGNTGAIAIKTPKGNASINGFTYLPLPEVTAFTPASAKKGTTVAIKGKNFTGTTAVSFGNTPAASFKVLSATTISAVVGNGATGKISVTTPYGSDAIAGFNYILADNTSIAPYPNPFQSVLYVNIGSKVVTAMSARVYNISSGKVIYSKTLSNQSGVVPLYLSMLNDGTYTLNITLDGVLTMYKIIKKN